MSGGDKERLMANPQKNVVMMLVVGSLGAIGGVGLSFVMGYAGST